MARRSVSADARALWIKNRARRGQLSDFLEQLLFALRAARLLVAAPAGERSPGVLQKFTLPLVDLRRVKAEALRQRRDGVLLPDRRQGDLRFEFCAVLGPGALHGLCSFRRSNLPLPHYLSWWVRILGSTSKRLFDLSEANASLRLRW